MWSVVYQFVCRVPNTVFNPSKDKVMRMKAKKQIAPGEEITVRYGGLYFGTDSPCQGQHGNTSTVRNAVRLLDTWTRYGQKRSNVRLNAEEVETISLSEAEPNPFEVLSPVVSHPGRNEGIYKSATSHKSRPQNRSRYRKRRHKYAS